MALVGDLAMIWVVTKVVKVMVGDVGCAVPVWMVGLSLGGGVTGAVISFARCLVAWSVTLILPAFALSCSPSTGPPRSPRSAPR